MGRIPLGRNCHFNHGGKFVETIAPEHHPLKKRSLLVAILFMILTLGNYPLFWFFRRRNALNLLGTKDKLGLISLMVFAALTLLSIAAGMYSDYLSQAGGAYRHVQDLKAIWLIGGMVIYPIYLFVLSNLVRHILNQYAERLGINFRVSILGIFLFNVLYLQYKINRLVGLSAVEQTAT